MKPSDAVRGEVRRSDHRRLSHGLYLPIRESLSTSDEILRDLRAWRLVLPDDAVFTHVTAAFLRGWWLPKLPRFVPVFAATGSTSNSPRRAGLICSRLDRGASDTFAQGLPVDVAPEVLLRAARDLALLDLVVMVDSALRQGDVTYADLQDICATGRPGVRQLRRAASLADPRSESAWETILRLFHHAVGIEVRPQADLHDRSGRWIARVDLWLPGTPFVHEYDGAHHDQAPQRRVDLRRLRSLNDGGFVRRGYVADDLVNHDLAMLQEMDRELGRPHQPHRLALWRRWVRESSYSDAGRLRLQNRWLRRGYVTDWWQTA